MENNRFLNLEVIWKDDDMFELRVTCSNGRYSGTTEVYETQSSLLSFTESLKGYPFNKGELSHSCGKEDGYAYFQMDFYQIGMTGVVGAEIRLEENVSTEYRIQEKDKLKMELIVEPNSIDRFRKELETLAHREEGIAELIGIEKHTNNIY